MDPIQAFKNIRTVYNIIFSFPLSLKVVSIIYWLLKWLVSENTIKIAWNTFLSDMFAILFRAADEFCHTPSFPKKSQQNCSSSKHTAYCKETRWAQNACGFKVNRELTS